MVSQPDGLGAFAALLKVHATAVRNLEQRLEDHRLVPLAQYDVLLELNAAPDRRLRMQQLGERVVLSRSRVSRVVDEMVRRGLVRREPDPQDRRGAYAVLTDAGRAALEAAAPVYLGGIEHEVLRHLTPTERRTLERLLGKVLAASEAAPDSYTGSP